MVDLKLLNIYFLSTAHGVSTCFNYEHPSGNWCNEAVFFSRKKIAGIFFHPKTFRVSWHVVGSGEAPNLTVDEVWNLTMVSFVYSGNSKQPYFHGCLVKQPDFM